MTLELVEKKDLAHVRMLVPGEEAALRSKKLGDADQEASETYHTVVKKVRKKLWIRCDCLGETSERPIIVVRKLRSDLYSLANMPHASVRHAKAAFSALSMKARTRQCGVNLRTFRSAMFSIRSRLEKTHGRPRSRCGTGPVEEVHGPVGRAADAWNAEHPA